MSRLDDIRDTYFRIARKLEKPGELEHAELSRHSAYCADVGYLLDLLEVHPVSEPPAPFHDVLLSLRGYTRHFLIGYYLDGEWISHETGQRIIYDVVSWQELPG